MLACLVFLFASGFMLLATDLHNTVQPFVLVPWCVTGVVAAALLAVSKTLAKRPSTARLPPATGAYVVFLLALGFGGLKIYGWVFGEDPHVRTRIMHRCYMNLVHIGIATNMYMMQNGGAYPDDLATLLAAGELGSEEFVCPATTDTPATGPTTRATAANLTAGGHLSYVYVGKGMTTATPRTAVVAYEAPSRHGGDGMHVLLADGSVKSLSPRQGKKVLAELDAGYNPPRP
jgi:prepilin-type processing-associated H-X9-DG protein